MMRPEIRYCRSVDGTQIAYTALGRGEPALLFVPGWAVTVEMELAFDEAIAFYTRLSENRLVVRYDLRGMGASARDARDYSIGAHLADAEAVAKALTLGPHDVFAAAYGSPVGLLYAHRYPEQVRRLVLWAAYAHGREYGSEEAIRAVLALAKANWALYTKLSADVIFPKAPEEIRMRWARLLRQATQPENAERFMLSRFDQDVRHIVEAVAQPVLALNRKGNRSVPAASTRRLASRLPNARFIELAGEAEGWWIGHQDFIEQLIRFLDEGTDRRPADGPSGASRTVLASGSLRTVLFTDIVGHTEMMQRLGDVKGRDVLREHERITREVLKAHSGTELKTMGDGFMASFGSVTSAMECAIALQRAFATHTESMPEPLHVRVGLNAGEPIEEDGDLFGATVIMASRVAAKAGAGEILIPEPLRHLLSGKSYVYADRGETMLKGFEDAVRLYEVRWRDEVA
jgi:class 3 adenylate cyclase/pimeloyl-ACP methyl ester carboxylesterase